MRLAGVNIPDEKRIEASLAYIYGIGQTSAKKILAKAKINPDKRTKELTTAEFNVLKEMVEKEYRVEGDLRREIFANIKRLKDIRSYRGLRHVKKLPARGQNTKRNSRTVRGNKRVTMTSGRKPAAQKT